MLRQPPTSHVLTPAPQRLAAWILAIDDLFARRPDLAGLHGPGEVALESVRSSA